MDLVEIDSDAGEAVAVVVAIGDRQQVELCSLVLLSVNIGHRIVSAADGWRLEVEPSRVVAARAHLLAFEEENRQWPPPEREVALASGPGWGLFLLLAGLMAFHGLTGPWTVGNPWFQRGAVDSGLVLRQGEWWRLITGLTLHADASHLLGNVALGGLVLSYLAAQTGSGAVWLLALVSGVLGNYLNVLYRGGGHRFAGFSTAVFGVIGCLCGLRIMARDRPRAILLPLGAGAGLLAMLGTEGEKTDVGAHLWGLGVGLLCGLLWHWPVSRGLWRAAGSQAALGAVSLLVVVVAWWLAMGG